MSFRVRSLITAGAVLLGFSLAACGSDGNGAPESVTEEASSSTTTSVPSSTVPTTAQAKATTDTASKTTTTTTTPRVLSELSMAPAPASGDLRDVDFLNGMMYVDHGFWPDENDSAPQRLFGPVVDGEYVNGEFGDVDVWAFYIDDVVYVDLDGDGSDEVVMNAATNGGGSGYFSELRAFDIEGDDIVELGIEYYGDRAFGGISHLASADNGTSVLVDVFIDGDGACCGHTVLQQRVGWADDELVVEQEFQPIRYVNTSVPSQQGELKFLPGTSTAQIGIAASSTHELQFDAQQDQLVSVTEYAGPGLANMRLTHLDTGDEVSLDGESSLPRDGMYALTLDANNPTDPERAFDWVTVILSIENAPPANQVEWVTVERDEAVRADPFDVTLAASYPRFPDYPEATQAVEVFVASQIDPWVEYATTADIPSDGDSHGSYELSSAVTLSAPSLVSVSFEYFEYLVGRPYPNYGFRSLVLDPQTGRVLDDGDIVDLSRRDEIEELFLTSLVTSGRFGDLESADVLALDTERDWYALWVTPEGLVFGVDRTGPLPSAEAFVPFTELGDLVMPEVLEAVRATS